MTVSGVSPRSEIAELKACTDAALPAPWTWRVTSDRRWAVVEQVDEADPGEFVAQCKDDDVAAFIVAARNALPALLVEREDQDRRIEELTAEVDRLRAENERLRGDVERGKARAEAVEKIEGRARGLAQERAAAAVARAEAAEAENRALRSEVHDLRLTNETLHADSVQVRALAARVRAVEALHVWTNDDEPAVQQEDKQQ